ncbi:MAG: ABC transporter substrate-binding protein [Geminicoccaceae bacterium]
MKRLLGVALAALLTLGGTSFAQEKMKVRIGVEGAYPPFSSVDPSGQVVGFDIDIANALCTAMNADCKLVQQDWDGIIPALLAKKYDAIIASMSITEERKKTVDFTNKYYQTPAQFVAKKGSGIEITKEGLAGKKVGVQRATTHDAFVTAKFGDTVEVVRYGTADEANLDLVAGRIDLRLDDIVALDQGLLKTDQGKDFEMVGPPQQDPIFGEGAGIAVRKGDDKLREAFNKAIDQIRADGTYKAIQDKYFTFDVYGS